MTRRLTFSMTETHHPEDGVQGEGEVGDGGAAQVHNWPEGLEVKHGLHRLVAWTALAFFTNQLTETHRHCPERAGSLKHFVLA